jgi:hypothetical protein
MRAQVTCEIVNINNINRKSTKNASQFVTNVWFFLYYFLLEMAVSYSELKLYCISFFGTVFPKQLHCS